MTLLLLLLLLAQLLLMSDGLSQSVSPSDSGEQRRELKESRSLLATKIEHTAHDRSKDEELVFMYQKGSEKFWPCPLLPHSQIEIL